MPHRHSEEWNATIGGGDLIIPHRHNNTRDVTSGGDEAIMPHRHSDKWDGSGNSKDGAPQRRQHGNKWDGSSDGKDSAPQRQQHDNQWNGSSDSKDSTPQRQPHGGKWDGSDINATWDAPTSKWDASRVDNNATVPPRCEDSTAPAQTSTDKTAPRRRCVVHHKTGDILAAEDDYIVHQTNCVTRTAGGLAKAIFKKWPHANTYSSGRRRTPGTISAHGDGKRQRRVINVYGQHQPGGPARTGKDTRTGRLQFFRDALRRLATYIMATRTGYTTVAFPARIGCGLARGNWTDYQRAILRFASGVNAKDGLEVKVSVYRLPES